MSFNPGFRIESLHVEGFRSLKDITWTPGKLNVLIGPNASGKSNLLDFLGFLSAMARGSVTEYVRARGGLHSLLWDGTADRIQAVLRLAGKAEDGGLAQYEYSFTVQPQGMMFIVCPEWLIRNPDQPETVFETTSVLQALLSRSPTYGLISSQERAAVAVRDTLALWQLHEWFDTSEHAAVRDAPVASYEPLLEEGGANLIGVLHTLYTDNQMFREQVDLAMEAAFPGFEELLFPPAADQRIQMRVRWKNLARSCPSSDLSDGTLRFLYLITILASPDPPPLIAIDEPETGLHPHMMPIIAEYAQSAARRTQVIVATHSPEFLGAFRDDPPLTTVVELDAGESRFHSLKADEIAHWLEEYTLGDLFRFGILESRA